MLFTDIIEAKKILEIDPDNKQEDIKLNFFIEQGSQWIEEILDRPGFAYATRTEYYGGTGTPNLQLKSRPVRTDPPIQVWEEEDGSFGQISGSFGSGTLLTNGTDYFLRIDQDNGRSRSGILIRNRDFWRKPVVRERGYLYPYVGKANGNIKVTYSGGYTVDDLPASFRMAMNILLAKMRYFFPLGMEMSSESYEERGISFTPNQKHYLIGLILPIILPYRNWKFG